MKKTLSFILSVVMVLGILTSVPLTVNAASVDDLTFELNEDGESYSVVDCSDDASGKLVIPATYNGLPVTNIGDYAFYQCNGVTSITIPNSVTSIGILAFSRCTGLFSIVIPDSVTNLGNSAFSGCTQLSSITLSSGLTDIGNSTFDNCDSLSSISFPDGITSIGDYSFLNCDSLKEIDLPDSLVYLGWYAFSECPSLESVVVPEGTEVIENYAFRECISLSSITLPDSLTSIGLNAFAYTEYYNNENNWESDVLYIDNHLIKARNSISGKYEIKKGTKVIGGSAFASCKELTTVIIPSSVTSICTESFCSCDNLESLFIPEAVTTIEPYSVGYSYYGYVDYKAIESFVIRGIAGSIAETYANENGFTFIGICEHTSTKWLTDKEATVNRAGSKHKECTECGEVLETATIKQLKCSKPKLKTIANTQSGVKITWSKVSGADTYRVYRKTKGGDWKYLGSTSKTGYTDKTAKSGTKYYYAVRARNEAGNSSLSSSLSKLYLADPTLKTPSSTKNGVSLKWTKTAGAQGYIIYRKTGSGSYKKLKTEKGVSNLSYRDKSAQKGKKYTYKVKAYYSKTYSAYSNTKTIKDKY